MARLSIPPVKVVPQLANIKVINMRRVLQPEGQRIVIRSEKPGPMSIRIVNLKGEISYTNRLVGPLDCSISTKGMSRGLYVVDVKSGMEQFRQKLYLK